VFKEQYGQTINAYLLGLRITKAKQLLRFTEKSVEEIGLECGLGALHYFSRVFKEIEGMAPSRYREQW
jgi:transcriptional regulator GlxA family with amidase domain